MREESTSCRPTEVSARPRRTREVRDPYDGLRPWSAITHGVGAVLAVVGTAVLLAHAAGDWVRFALFAVYGLTMVCLYTASTLYHCVNGSVAARLALRKYDHCSVYLLIAGSYTPICLLGLGGAGGAAMLAVIWTLAAAGVALTLVKLSIPRWLTAALYLGLGWAALFAIVPLHRALSAAGFFWLLTGGALYSAGGVLYALKWPARGAPRFGCHEIFHLFILLGSVAHFVMMLQL